MFKYVAGIRELILSYIKYNWVNDNKQVLQGEGKKKVKGCLKLLREKCTRVDIDWDMNSS